MLYWIGWETLHPGRQRSMDGPSGVAFSQIIAYMDEYGIEGRDDRDVFIELVQRMDRCYRNRVREESKKGLKEDK